MDDMKQMQRDCVGAGVLGVMSESLTSAAKLIFLTILKVMVEAQFYNFNSGVPDQYHWLNNFMEENYPQLLPEDMLLEPAMIYLHRFFGLHIIADEVTDSQMH